MLDDRAPDLADCWAFLAETAAFFGTRLPAVDDLDAAYRAFAAQRNAGAGLLAVTVTALDHGDGPRFVIGAKPVPASGGPVRIDVCDAPVARSGDAPWRRMAGRTTGMAERDHFRRWLGARGFADGVADEHGAPFLGALIFASGGDVGGLVDPEPTSLVDQLQRCGAIAGVRILDSRPDTADRAWWISPEYALHPVAELGTTSYDVSGDALPAWWRAR